MCITPPNASGQQFIYSADAGGKIYKLDLDGQPARLVRLERQEGRPVPLGPLDALRIGERDLHGRSAELARAEDHAMKPARTGGSTSSGK